MPSLSSSRPKKSLPPQSLPLDLQAVSSTDHPLGRQWRIEQHQHGHLLTVGHQLTRHLVGGDAPTREPAEQVGAMRLHRAQLLAFEELIEVLAPLQFIIIDFFLDNLNRTDIDPT